MIFIEPKKNFGKKKKKTLANALIKGSLSCILPAVSTKTTSKPWELAKMGNDDYFIEDWLII